MRIRICEYDLNYGALGPVTGTVGVALDSAVQLLQGVKEIRAPLPKPLTKGHGPIDAVSNKAKHTGFTDSLKGAGKVSRVAIQAPINAGVAVTQGIHNTPRFSGGQVRRKQPCVTSVSSGLKAGGNVSTLFSFTLFAFQYCFPNILTAVGAPFWHI